VPSDRSDAVEVGAVVEDGHLECPDERVPLLRVAWRGVAWRAETSISRPRPARGLIRELLCSHNERVTSVLVRDLLHDVHAALQRRAARRGHSLQQHLLVEPTRLAEKPTLDEALDRIERPRGEGVGPGQATMDVAEERTNR